MKKEISSFMDGELDEEKSEVLLSGLRRNTEASGAWSAYHLIGDAMRQTQFTIPDISAEVAKRLQDEPTVLAPRSRRQDRMGYFAMTAVASIMAIAFLAWLSVRLEDAPAYQPQRMAASEFSQPAMQQNERVNDYLLAHQEFSPGNDVRGASSFVRTVAFQQGGAGK